MYKIDQVCTDNTQKNSPWLEGRLFILRLKNSDTVIFPQAKRILKVNESASDYVICCCE